MGEWLGPSSYALAIPLRRRIYVRERRNDPGTLQKSTSRTKFGRRELR
jgi:hypothetical protein